MKPVLFVIAVAFSMCAAGCGRGNTVGEITVFDVGAAIDNPRVFDLAEIAEKIEFIPLDDTHKESLVGNIDAIAESPDRWYVQHFASPVKVFDKTGKFIDTRGVIGRGPDEFTWILGMVVDPVGDNLYISSFEKMVGYDRHGRVFARSSSLSAGQFAFHDGLLIAHTTSGNPDPEPGSVVNRLMFYSPDLEPVDSVRAADPGSSTVFARNPNLTQTSFDIDYLSYNGNSLMVKSGRVDTVFILREGALVPAYRLDMGSLAPPAGAFGEYPTVPWDTRFRLVRHSWDSSRYLLVWAGTGMMGGELWFCIFDRNGDGAGFSTAGPDGKSQFLAGGIAFAPEYIREGRLVGYMQALDIVDNAGSITNPDLRALAAGLREDSNPVIVVATLKK